MRSVQLPSLTAAFVGGRNEADQGADELEEERERTAAKRRKVKLESRKVST
jgi:hypothetical protein